MTGEGIEPPLFLFVRQAPYHLGDPAEMRETRFELAIPIWKTGVIPASPLSQKKEPETGIEPVASDLQDPRSPLELLGRLATPAGLEPAASCFVDRRSDSI